MDSNFLTADDFEGIQPKPNCFEFDNLVAVAFLALAKSKGMPKTEVIRKLQRSKNPDVVGDNERERGKRNKSPDAQPSLPNPSSFINFQKRKRSPMRENVKPPPSTVPSILIPNVKEPKVEALMMLERQECFSVDAEVKKTQTGPLETRIRSDIGCSNIGENTRPTKNPEVGEDRGLVPHPDLSIPSSKNPEEVVDEERERGERDKYLDDQPSLPNPSSFIDIPKRKRSPMRENVKPPPSTVPSILIPIDKEPKIEALMMIERDKEIFGVDVKGKKTQRPCLRKRIRSDIGCSNGEKARPMKKKKKKRDCGPLPPPDLPQNFRDKIQALNGCELKLVIQKLLSISDVDRKKYRMSIPIGEIRNEFLRSEEKAMFDSGEEKGKIKGIEVELIEPSCERVTTLSLRKWWMNKGNGKTNPIYNLANINWYKKVVLGNGLGEKTVVQLWAFRVEGKLQFALVKVEGAGGGDGGEVGGHSGDGGGESGIGSSSGGSGRGEADTTS
ncbi:hypothetical protein RHMOL_Rhmol07G0251100 [Rhododendron molle]|uniref:Uncharacterized protein n=1 Tax=Rhododendron molle TaxID=49168 RepID=A0ACC0N5K5_RHOML|nr:hypothetical protein RHMOL_Rhmol07G0251100 [Rhododendron molle]